MSSDSGNSRENRNDASGFFNVGAPLHAVRAGYIRRPADDLLIEAVSASRYVHIIAPNRTGKSSLIAGAAAHLENNGVRVATLDLEQISTREPGKDAGRWYYNVAYRLSRQLRIRVDLQEWWQDKSILSNRQRLLEFYTEIILGNIDGAIVVFIDAIQRIGDLPFGEQLLTSIRSAYDARSADPEFSRLTFVLVGECDPTALAPEVETSPFNVSQGIVLDDFSRSDIAIYAPELNVGAEHAGLVLDRVYYWTRGHPYLTQKLCRAISRAGKYDDPEEFVDKLVQQQFSGKAALNSEPHLGHIHHQLVTDRRANREAVLNVYGRIRKGVDVPTDLSSDGQRRLIAVGLLELDELGALRIRNRIYEMVFTARWANENLPSQWRGPAAAAALIVLMLAIPFWYTQLLPQPYVAVLNGFDTEPATASSTWQNFRSFPGHTEVADAMFRQYLERRARAIDAESDFAVVAAMARDLSPRDRLAERLTAEFWDRRAASAKRAEQREAALLATIRSFELSTSERRSEASMLIGEDWPLLIDTVPAPGSQSPQFDPYNGILSTIDGSSVAQWSIGSRGIEARDGWTLTTLEISPLVRRIAVDTAGTVRRIGLSINLSHQRLSDISVRVIAPSGRSVQVELDAERSTSSETLRIPPGQLTELIGESLTGTWSISVRDEAIGFGGQLVGWNLNLNSQGLIEDFQRGLNIPNPVEVPADDVWLSSDRRFAIARAAASDSVRVWDLAFAKPLGTLFFGKNEKLLGVIADGQRLVSATQESVHVWDISTGRLSQNLPLSPDFASIELVPGGDRLLLTGLGDEQTKFALWSLNDERPIASLTVAGTPVLVASSSNGSTLAIADANRSVRLWRFGGDEREAQLDLPMQPQNIVLSPDGSQVGIVYEKSGVAQYAWDRPGEPVFEEFGQGDWRFRFSPSGLYSISGHGRSGYQVRYVADGRPRGPLLGLHTETGQGLVAFTDDEQMLLTPAAEGALRLWRIAPGSERISPPNHSVWSPALDGEVRLSPDASLIATADRSGHVHILNAGSASLAVSDASEEVSYLGHEGTVRQLALSKAAGLAASIGEDDRLKFWRLDDGLPTGASLEVSAGEIKKLAFSPTGAELVLLSDSRLIVVDASTATVVQELDFLEPLSDFIHVDDRQIYLASESGSLQSATRADDTDWNSVRIWDGGAPIALLALSPDKRRLVVAGADGSLRQLDLETSLVQPRSLSLPPPIVEVGFAPVGSRVIARTERWAHELSSLPQGLAWSDAMLLPRVPGHARMAFGRETSTFHLPVVIEGRVRLETYRFGDAERDALFGSLEQLLEAWRTKLGVTDP